MEVLDKVGTKEPGDKTVSGFDGVADAVDRRTPRRIFLSGV